MPGRFRALLSLAALPLLLGVGVANVPAFKAKPVARTAPFCPPGSPECTPDCFFDKAPAEAPCCESGCCEECQKAAPATAENHKAETPKRAFPHCPPCPFCP